MQVQKVTDWWKHSEQTGEEILSHEASENRRRFRSFPLQSPFHLEIFGRRLSKNATKKPQKSGTFWRKWIGSNKTDRWWENETHAKTWAKANYETGLKKNGGGIMELFELHQWKQNANKTKSGWNESGGTGGGGLPSNEDVKSSSSNAIRRSQPRKACIFSFHVVVANVSTFRTRRGKKKKNRRKFLTKVTRNLFWL